MAEHREIAVLVGSLRHNSYSARIAAAAAKLAPPHLHFNTVALGELPLYNQDHDGEKAPPAYAPFRSAIAKADGVLFVTPEYNRSLPGALKNAIDVGSRPYGKGAIIGKPAAIISQSPGPMGAFGANHAIRQSLVFLNMPILQQPEAYLGHISQAVDEAGNLTSDAVKDLLTRFTVAFADLIDRCRK